MGNCVGKNVTATSSVNEGSFDYGNAHNIIDKEDWEDKISEANKESKMVVANFTASWCGPCRAIAPFYSELSKKYPELVFLVVNVDELAELCSIWDIRATPTFYFLKDGEQLDKMIWSKQPELEQKNASS